MNDDTNPSRCAESWLGLSCARGEEGRRAVEAGRARESFGRAHADNGGVNVTWVEG